MTNYYKLHKGKWRKIENLTSPLKESFVVSTVNYAPKKFDTVVFKADRQGTIKDTRTVYRYCCTDIEEAKYRHDVICTLLRRGKYVWLDEHDIFFN